MLYIIALAVYRLLNVISYIILIRCIMSWFPGATRTKLYEILSMLTDPIEEPIRSVLYKYVNGPLDFTPIVALLLIRVAQRVVVMFM